MTQYYQDYQDYPQAFGGGEYAPQGLLSSALGFAAPYVGAAIGKRFGNAGLGRQIGSAAGAFSHFLPFEAAPEMPGGYYGPQGGGEYAPQGLIGDLVSRALPFVGQTVGGRFGNAGIGRQIGSMAAPWAQRFIPFEAAPEMPGGYYGYA
ncbi:MAG TPA: hypothetical protein VFP12_03705 [Allosphingosinicella sp.]|nr:hypothetical protein [Allosphingosinicella sp.]